MLKYGEHPRSGNIVIVRGISQGNSQYFRCTVIAIDRIYKTVYSKQKLERQFEPLSKRKYKQKALIRIQYSLF